MSLIMSFVGLKFWFNLTLTACTSYLLVWYILTPPANQCQMTFMMEPPRFLPIHLDAKDPSILSYPELSIDGLTKKEEPYKLYMYSEFGFPQASNVRRDLRDSMPVLFVPGNAGSYQQVRSLASTCIRRQLQSLDAFKFVFYTIDFRGQFSGVSGHLIEQQILFVHKSLEHIRRMHPTETGGVIVIGHSVGGFIAKALVTVADFNLDSVPLLISLASPLTGPYLNFDEKMRDLYERTNLFWDRRSKTNSLAISISGGRSDRLVPMHLSMDPQFDISLTTSTMKDVWLTTDHVCITWCRELVHKLSHLLSSLMDKKQTKLISDKEILKSIVLRELFGDKRSKQLGNLSVIQSEWKVSKALEVVKLDNYLSFSRSRLSETAFIIDIKHLQPKDLQISVDYIDALKGNAVSGCKALNLSSSDNRITCLERVNLLDLLSQVPTRRFEPKKGILKIRSEDLLNINHIVLDFVPNYADRNGNKVPELVTAQQLSSPKERSLNIPSLPEYIFRRIFFIDSYVYEIESQQVPYTSAKYKLINLKYNTQLFSLVFRSKHCQSSDDQKSSTTIVLTQGNLVKESFYPISNDKETTTTTIRINPRISILFNDRSMSNETSLEFYIDGTCENSLQIFIDPLDLAIDNIHRNLGQILAYTTFLTCKTIVETTSDINQKISSVNSLQQVVRHIATMVGFSILYLSSAPTLRVSYIATHIYSLQDEIVANILMWTLASGLLAFSVHIATRLMDIAIILNNVQQLLRRKVSAHTGETRIEEPDYIEGDHMVTRSLSVHFDWVLVCLGAAGGLIFSPVLVSILLMFILIKSELHLTNFNAKELRVKSSVANGSKHLPPPNDQKQQPVSYNVHNLLVSIAVLNALALLSNIPAALLLINSSRFESMGSVFASMGRDSSFIQTIVSLCIVKYISENIDCLISHQKANNKKTISRSVYGLARFVKTKHLYMTALAPILMIEGNMCSINLVLLLMLIWVYPSIVCKNHDAGKLEVA